MRAAVPTFVVGTALAVLGAGCRIEHLSGDDADAFGAEALDAVAAEPAPPEVAAALDAWLACAASVDDVDLRVVGGASDPGAGVAVVAHEGTASRRAVRAAADEGTVTCARNRLADRTFVASSLAPPDDGDAAARAETTIAGEAVALSMVAVNAFVVLGPEEADVLAAVAVIEERT